MQTIFIGRHPITDGVYSDVEAFEELLRLNERLKEDADAGRPVVYLLLQDRKMAKLLNIRAFADDMHRQMDVIVTTCEELWAQHLFVTNVMRKVCRGLDYENIRYEDDKIVHIVIFGTNSQAVALSETVALVAHYPNYLRDHNKRTRITFVAEGMREFMTRFTAEHTSLMDNLYYRYVDVAHESLEISRPLYEGLREDFADIEFEFVEANFSNPSIQIKLKYWAESESKLLSVAFCGENTIDNVYDALTLNREIGERNIPIYAQTNNEEVYKKLLHPENDSNIIIFGNMDKLLVIDQALLSAAKYVNYVYDFCYNNDGRIPMIINHKDAESKWLNVKTALRRNSNLCNAMTIGTKMHTLGHREDDWCNFYAITSEELDMLSQIEHNRWSIEQLLHGFRPCTEEEQEEIENDIGKKELLKKRFVHFDLCAYNDLR